MTEMQLGELIKLEKKVRPDKPGRAITVAWDERYPFIKDFALRYVYWLNFDQKNSVAGRHYHKEKAELFIPLHGDFSVTLEDVSTKQRETHELSSKKSNALFIAKNISHKVTSLHENGILLILASSPADEADAHSYDM